MALFAGHLHIIIHSFGLLSHSQWVWPVLLDLSLFSLYLNKAFPSEGMISDEPFSFVGDLGEKVRY